MTRVLPSLVRRVPRSLRRPSWPGLAWLVLLVIALVVGLVYAANSNAVDTDSRTATDQPPDSRAPLDEELSPQWSADSDVDDQRTVAGNTVIVSTSDGVRGLDPLTGQERWRYLRPSATMCDLTVLDDVVVAIFKTTGRCNEAVALEADSGLRRWYRNVGFSDQLRMFGSGTAALAATPGGIAILDAVGNSIRWRYNPPRGCELSSVGIGTSGVVVVERCTTGTTWLAAFALTSGKQQWRVAPPPGEVSVLGADGVVSLLAGQELMILSARDGSMLSTLRAGPADPAELGQTAGTLFAGPTGARGLSLIYLAPTLYAIDPATGAQLWSVAAAGLPARSDVGIVVPEVDGFVTRNPLTGQELGRSVITAGSGAADGPTDTLVRVERAGSALVATTRDGLVGYA